MYLRSVKMLLILAVCFVSIGFCQTTSQQLEQQIQAIASATKGKVGVAVIHLDTQEKILFNATTKLPMQSTYKFPLGMAVMAQIDQQKRKLTDKIYLTRNDFSPDLYSPLRDKYPNANVEVSLQEIIEYTVGQSDNSGCDLLFKMLDGPRQVHKYVQKLGIKDMNIANPEAEIQRRWEVQYANYATPLAMAQLFEKLSKKALSASSRDFLMQTMLNSPTGAKRLKYLLPPNTPVAHKTGTSGRNPAGMAGAINDGGIVTLSNGQRFVIVVFVSDATEPDAVLENIIAQTAKATFDYFSSKP